MFLVALCESPGFLRLLLFSKTIIEIICVVVPILLIVFLMIDLLKVTVSKDPNDKTYKKVIFNRIIAAVIVFFVPTIVNFIGVITESITDADICWDKATNENIAYLQSIKDATEKANYESIVKQREEAQIKAEAEKNGTVEETVVEDVIISSVSQEGTTVNVGTTNYYNEVSDERGAFGYFTYNDEPEGREITMNPAWKKANLISYSFTCGSWTYKKTIHRLARPYFEAAMNNICKLLTTGINGYKLSASDLKNGGVFNERKTSSGGYSNHAWGIAVDFNYSSTYTVAGKTYKPYNHSGKSTFEEYCNFIKAIGNNETSNKNINYVLWKYAFEPAGFCWGGNWSEGYFDPMHYEINWNNRDCPTKLNRCN